MTYVAISLGAILGANARFLLGGWILERFGPGFPLGTLVINVTGSFVIGVVYVMLERHAAPDWVRPLVMIGFLGAYTTFSTFSYETLSLVNAGSVAAAAANIGVSVAGAMIAVYLGTVVGRLV